MRLIGRGRVSGKRQNKRLSYPPGYSLPPLSPPNTWTFFAFAPNEHPPLLTKTAAPPTTGSLTSSMVSTVSSDKGEQASRGRATTTAVSPRGSVAPNTAERNSNASDLLPGTPADLDEVTMNPESTCTSHGKESKSVWR